MPTAMDFRQHWRLWVCSESNGAGSITRRRLSGRVKRLEERHQCRSLRGTQVLSVGRHVAAALDHLADELILRELSSYLIQFWPRSPPTPPRAWQLWHCFA